MERRKLATVLAWVVLSLAPAAALAQQDQIRQRVDTLRAKANAGTVGIISGGVDGTYVRIAADLSSVLDDGDRLRILPVIGKGSLQNISDILFLRGIDIGIVQSDVLAYAKRQPPYPGVERSVQYITKLYDEELHVLARQDIARIEELAGRKVNIDLNGSGTSMTASLVFERLGIEIDPAHDDQALALEKLRRGDISALVYVAGKPARLFRDLRPEDGLHLLAVPSTDALLETYLPASFTSDDYELVRDAPVETIAVGAVMAVYAWAPGSERYRKVEQFVQSFFGNFDAFLEPPRHAKWKDVNLAAEVPGWTRFPAAEEWLRREAVAGTSARPLREDFEAFLERTGNRTAIPAALEAELFEEFLRWQQAGGKAR
jgi:TRAP transporter TAXI family solute receptor